jgi:hypothetical protein
MELKAGNEVSFDQSSQHALWLFCEKLASFHEKGITYTGVELPCSRFCINRARLQNRPARLGLSGPRGHRCSNRSFDESSELTKIFKKGSAQFLKDFPYYFLGA